MKTLILLILIFCSCSINGQAGVVLPSKNERGAAGPAWGTYSNRYAGISHVADSLKGWRFDFSVFLGQYWGKVTVPNARFESDWYPWDASPDLNYFSFREELEWKDKVFADIAFAPLDAHRRLMKISITNNLSTSQSLALHFVAGMVYPEEHPTQVVTPAGRTWTSAIDYTTMEYAQPRRDDHLITDGLLKGEVRNPDFVNGSGLAAGFGATGDRVTYTLQAPADFTNGILMLRYRIAAGKKATFSVEGMPSGQLELEGTGSFELKKMSLGALKKGIKNVKLTALTNVPVELDGLTIVEENEVASVRFETPVKQPVPATEQPCQKSVLLKYAAVPQYYGIAWNDNTEYKLRELSTDELDNAIRTIAGDEIYPHHYTKKNAHTTNVFLRAVQLPDHTTKTMYAVITDGSREEVVRNCQSFPATEVVEAAFKKYTGGAVAKVNSAGQPYTFSTHLLQATALQNIVYPIYTQRQFTKQFVPGKRWSSLYTWDNGFTGIGIANVAIERAIESLQPYTTDSTSTNAYTHHGSLVPVQFLLYKEIWDKTLSKEMLRYFYPRLKKYYRFFCGDDSSSATRKLSSGLLSTFDYFYNSGGWDDYPAQAYMHAKKFAGVTAPAISSSMAIRIAKIMSQAATLLNLQKDAAFYQKDIDFFTKALQKYSWDEPSGYFSYVVHDATTGYPTGILRTADGINYNMGLDGIYPLVAGICTPAQRAAALSHLFSNKACWTDIGISAVDQSAPYFSLQGYWNGAVWFPHQWIFWKKMLDEGEAAKASQIGLTALKLYANEADSTYFTAENFRIDTHQGGGWKQFGALSAPILSWYNAYFVPGTITTGFDAWVKTKTFSPDQHTLKATLQLTNTIGKRPALLVCMPEGKKYRVKINGQLTPYTEAVPGTLQIKTPNNNQNNIELIIEPES